MTLTLTHDLGLGAVQLEPADPLAPPPPGKKDRWSQSLTLLLALVLNALIIGIIFFRFPDRVPQRPAEPPSIPVELVQQPKPQEQAKPKPEEQPKAQPPKPEPPKPEPKREEPLQYRESGGSPDLAPGRAPKTEEKAVEEPPKPEAKITKPEPPKQAIPDWARQLEQGFGIPRPRDRSKITTSQASRAKPNDAFSRRLGAGGGDRYLNELRDLITARIVFPPSAASAAIGQANYQVTIDNRGALRAVKVFRSSGSVAFDRAVVSAIQSASPFPPPPFDLGNSSTISLMFYFAPNSRE